jgi:periplasmic protein TonB
MNSYLPKRSLLSRLLFPIILLLSISIHLGVYAAYYISQYQEEKEEIVSSENINQEVDIMEEIPPELLGGKSSPAPVEKNDWVEGKKDTQTDDPTDSDINENAVSGNGTDKDGYLYSFNGDRVPTLTIDARLRDFFPKAAIDAGISEKLVVISVQIDENGNLMSSKIVSGKAGYGFDEAALKIISIARFTPGYVNGQPVKMSHRVSINFTLDE